MKKIMLLFTLLCAGQIYGMEPLYPKQQPKILTQQEKKELVEFYRSRLPELKQEIIRQALKSSTTLDEAIDRVKIFSALNGIKFDELFNNIKDFTMLVHILSSIYIRPVADIAKKLGVPEEMVVKLASTLTPEKIAQEFKFNTVEIAQKINTPTAKKYIELGDELVSAVAQLEEYWPDYINEITQLINDGADVNFSNIYGRTPLLKTIQSLNPQGVAFLLQAGAKPSQLEVEVNNNLVARSNKAKIIKQLLEDAMQKK